MSISFSKFAFNDLTGELKGDLLNSLVYKEKKMTWREKGCEGVKDLPKRLGG